jgi:hypothetical protein
VQRLTHALQEAQAVTLEAKAILQQAEEEAQRLFGGEGFVGAPGGGSGALGGGNGANGLSPLARVGFGGLALGATVANHLRKYASIELPFLEKNLGEVWKFNPGIVAKVPFILKNSFINESLFNTSGSMGDIPARAKGDVKFLGHGNIGAAIGFTKDDGFVVGAYGNAYAAKASVLGVLGDKDLGLTGKGELTAGEFEGFAGYKDGNIGATIGVNVISAELEAGANIAGVNVGIKGEVGLKAELGFKIGADGIEAKFPLFSVGLSFGGAK